MSSALQATEDEEGRSVFTELALGSCLLGVGSDLDGEACLRTHTWKRASKDGDVRSPVVTFLDFNQAQ